MSGRSKTATRCVAAVIACALVALLPGARPAAAAETVEIPVILSLTGGAALLGQKDAQTLSVVEQVVNKSGGIGGRLLKFSIRDDSSVPQNAVELTNEVIASHAPVVIGPAVAATCSASLPLVDKAGPVMFCLATPVQPDPGSFMVIGGPSTKDYIRGTLQYFRSRGWTRVGLMLATDASGQAYERDFNAALLDAQGRGFEVVDREHFNVADVSMAAQVARLKGANPQVIVTFSVGPSFGTFLRQCFDSGVSLPIVGSGANLNYGQLAQYRSFAPKELLFATSRGAAADPDAPPSVKTAYTDFVRAFKDAGIRVEFLHTLAWDPAFLVVSALRRYGPNATPKQIHDYLLGLQNWTGILGSYSFARYPQRGVGFNAIVMYRWDADKNEVATIPIPKSAVLLR